ncbi:MAG: branched-chain amino acid aminotransferase [Chitinophagales bacterium]
MELTAEIPVRRTAHSKLDEVDFNDLKFGTQVSDHMLVSDYKNGEWYQPQILPFANLSLSPATLALHYGQTVFEGMKAFRMQDGRINIFRIDKHYERFVKSLERMCMAVVPKEIFTEGLIRLVEVDQAWVPEKEDFALYLRPFMIATEARFGVKVSDEYRFIIFTGPVPLVYSKPIKVKVETNYIRAARGGTGSTKCGGNYGGSFYPTQLARKEGYDQVLWTDAGQRKFIEESGMMNVMFMINNTLVTPPLSDSILDGVTRDSILTLATQMGYKTEERPISIEELETAFRNKTITEAAGIGTAAVIAPIGVINLNEIDFHLPEYSHENVFYKLKQQLESIRSGRSADVNGWNCIL